MKRHIVVKHFPGTDVAHLYEHLFCAKLNSELLDKSIYQYIDYAIVAKTHRPGVIIIDIQTYTDLAESTITKKFLNRLKIKLKNTSILNAITQIHAEEERPLIVIDRKVLKKQLSEIDTTVWQSIDDITTIDFDQNNEAGAFYVAIGDPEPAQRLEVSVGINSALFTQNTYLEAAFYEFSKTILENLQITLAADFGIYSYKDTYMSKKTNASYTNTFKVAKNITITDTDTITKRIQKMSHDILQPDVLKRFRTSLLQKSFSDNPNIIPQFEDLYQHSKLFIGQKGWDQILTKENMALVADNLKISIVNN